MISNGDKFKVYKMFNQIKPIYTGSGIIYVHRIEKVKVLIHQIFGSPKTITLYNILYTPSLITNLILILILRKNKTYC